MTGFRFDRPAVWRKVSGGSGDGRGEVAAEVEVEAGVFGDALFGEVQAAAFWAARFEQLIEAYTHIVSLFNAPVLGLFLLGLLTRRATFPGGLVGTALAIPATQWLSTTPVHWAWLFPFSLAVTFAAGYAASLLLPAAARWPLVSGESAAVRETVAERFPEVRDGQEGADEPDHRAKHQPGGQAKPGPVFPAQQEPGSAKHGEQQ